MKHQKKVRCTGIHPVFVGFEKLQRSSHIFYDTAWTHIYETKLSIFTSIAMHGYTYFLVISSLILLAPCKPADPIVPGSAPPSCPPSELSSLSSLPTLSFASRPAQGATAGRTGLGRSPMLCGVVATPNLSGAGIRVPALLGL